MGGLCSGFGYRKGTCVTIYKRAWPGRLMTASRKAERLSGVGLPRPLPGGTRLSMVPETGEKPEKMTFSNFPLIWRFREFLGVSYQGEKQAKIKLIFLVLYKKMKNGVMGCLPSFAQKKIT